MQKDPSLVAEEFWKPLVFYPDYHHTPQRRWHDLNFIMPRISNVGVLVDLGAGDGTLLMMLNDVTDILQFHLYDISTNLLKIASNRWPNDNLRCYPGNLFENKKAIKHGDLTICMGLLCYCFDDSKLLRLLQKVRDTIIVRVPCAGYKRTIVNNHSNLLGGMYSAIYRTVGEYHNLFSKNFTITYLDRAWPDNIESKYPHRQYNFVLERK